MNKRIKKKLAKKNESKVQKGYGVITGNKHETGDGIKHYYPIGTVVRIDYMNGLSADCVDEKTNLEQRVSLIHIAIGG
ncbi:hypothetical protein [Peribacillus asahii]|uniref:hypothetical protein n=1 Tax=Peribacillus asahii TaxID=228899 RepID=UPI0037F3C0CE